MSNASIQDSGMEYKGHFSVNQAAGDHQLQTNVRAIAIGSDAVLSAQVNQRLNTPASRSMNATAKIGGNSFSNGNGVMA